MPKKIIKLMLEAFIAEIAKANFILVMVEVIIMIVIVMMEMIITAYLIIIIVALIPVETLDSFSKTVITNLIFILTATYIN